MADILQDFPIRASRDRVFAVFTMPQGLDQWWTTSCHCWALYLRVLRRHLENGESVPYDDRLDV